MSDEILGGVELAVHQNSLHFFIDEAEIKILQNTNMKQTKKQKNKKTMIENKCPPLSNNVYMLLQLICLSIYL